MALDTSIKRCEADSPNRCQALGAQGSQCLNEAMRLSDGTFAKNCSFHGGVDEENKKSTHRQNMYRLAKFGERVKDFASHNQVKGLRDEIGILRMVLEERLNRCQDNDELILSSNVIGDLVLKIERLVTSCHKLEASMGQLLDRQQIIQFAEAVVKVVADHIQDPAALALIAGAIERITEEQLSGAEKKHEEAKSTPMRTALE
jgi:hypothetical protein